MMDTNAHHRLIVYLTRLYPVEPLARHGVVYPVTVFPANTRAEAPWQDTLTETITDAVYRNPSSVRGDVDRFLAPDIPRDFADRASFAIYDDDHLSTLRQFHPYLTNGVAFVMDRIEHAGAHGGTPLQISARLGYYFDMLATCDALDHETRRYARGEQNNLPLREQFHQVISPQQALADGMGRCAVIGIAALTVYRHAGAYHAILGRRAGSVGIDAGQFHVVPALVFQPHTSEPAEWSVQHHICREFGEELFGMPEYDDWVSPQGAGYFYEFPPVADLRAMLADGRADLYLTGLAFNLMTLRPEICTLLLIHNPDWYARSEAALHAARLTERQETHRIAIATLDGLPDHLHLTMTPQGAAAFWLGIERAREAVG